MAKTKPYRHLVHLAPFADQPIVFFTTVIHKRRGLLDNSIVHEELHGIWERSAECNGWYVGDYLLMPDHAHLFARASPDADSMSRWLKMWKSVSSRCVVSAFEERPPIWQEGYFDRYLRTSESYEQKWEYVRYNPVRAGLVADPDDWSYKGRIFELRY